jgi:hypothetical protein
MKCYHDNIIYMYVHLYDKIVLREHSGHCGNEALRQPYTSKVSGDAVTPSTPDKRTINTEAFSREAVTRPVWRLRPIPSRSSCPYKP